MNAFKKELAGLLCSDFQIDRVMNNKIAPQILDVFANRMESESDAVELLVNSMTILALDVFTGRSFFWVRVSKIENEETLQLWSLVRPFFSISFITQYMITSWEGREKAPTRDQTEKYLLDIESYYRQTTDK